MASVRVPPDALNSPRDQSPAPSSDTLGPETSSPCAAASADKAADGTRSVIPDGVTVSVGNEADMRAEDGNRAASDS
jgi:hypothetical protein